MILTAHQPAYLPWLGLFHKIASADVYVSFSEVQYVPKDWINRNRIKTPQGAQWLTVPVMDKGHRAMKISDMKINNSVPWKRKHWKTIEQNYSKAPHFAEYKGFFEDVYAHKWTYLADFNEHMLFHYLSALGIRTRLLFARDYNFRGQKSDLVLDMCKQLGASRYIFGAQGRNYARVEDFESAEINLEFQDYQHPVYPQLHGEFISHLSIIDLLFNCGDESRRILMGG